MIKASFTAAALLALTIAACQQPDESNIAVDAVNNLDATEMVLPPDDSSAPAQGTPAPAPTVTPPENAIGNDAEDDSENSPSTAIIPAQYRGRWGMVRADCTSTRGDAKGLMIVRANNIRFYESTASLQEQRPAIATSFSGTYSFAGEGQTWERVVTLTRTGNTLKRADSEGSFTYTRCA